MNDILQELARLDDLRVGHIGECALYVHEDHRWSLALLAHAQEQGQVPRPCRLVMFDRHSDAATPRCLQRLGSIRDQSPNSAEVLEICRSLLNTDDGDWLVAGMELGLVSHAVVLGAEDTRARRGVIRHADSSGTEHRVHFMGLPHDALGFQGDLSDMARTEQLAELWTALGWSHGRAGFSFEGPPAFVSIDLDCFVVSHRDKHLLPWPREVYEVEFLAPPADYPSMSAWTGRSLVHALLARSGVLDIAREPDFCGGPIKSEGFSVTWTTSSLTDASEQA